MSLSQLTSPPRFHVIHIPKGNLVLIVVLIVVFRWRSMPTELSLPRYNTCLSIATNALTYKCAGLRKSPQGSINTLH